MNQDSMRHNLHVVVMVLCFVYGGVSLAFFMVMSGSLVSSSERGPAFIANEFETLLNESCDDSGNCTLHVPPTGIERFQRNVSTPFYIILFVSLSGSVISITAGTSLWFLLRKKERKKLTDDIVNTMTTEDEKLVMRVLEEHGNELTQSDIVKRTKLSKVKVHRVIKRLESLGIVSKYSYGMTNKIRLKDLHEKK